MEKEIQARAVLRAAEESGLVGDSMTVRRALMARVRAGEITLETAQAELARIKKGGKITRSQVLSGRR